MITSFSFSVLSFPYFVLLYFSWSLSQFTCIVLICFSIDKWIMDVSYPGRFVHKTIRTQVGRFVSSGLDVSYPKPGRFVPRSWMFRNQGLDVLYPMFLLIFRIWFGIFAFKIVRFIQPIECWSIPTHLVFHFLYLSSSFSHVFIHQCISWVNIKICARKDTAR